MRGLSGASAPRQPPLRIVCSPMGRRLAAVILFVMALSAVDLVLDLAAGEDGSDTAAYVRVGISVLVAFIATGIYLWATRKVSQADTPGEAAARPSAPVSRRPVAPTGPAVFISCSVCGNKMNQSLGQCPYCRAVLDAGGGP